MTFPKVSEACVLATVSKCTQVHPQEFATQTMTALMSEQPALMAAITELLLASGGGDIEEMESQLMSTFCILGVSLKAMAAQIEADELNEAWGE
ncbi:MAG: hypothetical protein CMH30_00825 [Micavibrio sp.]|nr:hypothetical protein [Micavibrio sp.]